MLGLGERDEEVEQALRDLRAAGVDFVTSANICVRRRGISKYKNTWSPPSSSTGALRGRELGFLVTASGPLVRSPYRAGEFQIAAILAEKERA